MDSLSRTTYTGLIEQKILKLSLIEFSTHFITINTTTTAVHICCYNIQKYGRLQSVIKINLFPEIIIIRAILF